MRLETLISKCNWEACHLPDPERRITGGYTSDLLSDVMAHCAEGALLITVQNHTNTVAVCTLVGAPALLLVHQRTIPPEMLAAAQREGIALLRTTASQFEASVSLAAALDSRPPG